MLTRSLIILALTCAFSFGADAPPSEASIKQLLEVMHAHQMLDTMTSQLDDMIKTAMQQATMGQPAPPAVEKSFEKCRTDVTTAFQEIFTWEKLEPMYIRIYQKSFTQSEVEGMIAFYGTSTGQAVISKMPVVMQHTMKETMQMMGPMMQRIHQMQREMAAEMKEAAGSKKTG